jgi:Helix-turn-helix domain
MSCTEPVARSAHAADRTALPRIKPRQWRWRSHSQRSEGPDISRRKEGLNSAATLSGRALYTVPEAMEMLNLSRTVTFKQIRSGRLMTVTQGRRRLVPASSMTAYVDLLVTEAMARTNARTP